MPIINGLDRCQMTFSSLEDSISADNEVRFIDAFVDKLDLQQLGVQSLTAKDHCRPKRFLGLRKCGFKDFFTVFKPVSKIYPYLIRSWSPWSPVIGL